MEGGPAHYPIRPPGEAEGGTPDAVRQQSLPAPGGARSRPQGPDQDRGLGASDAAPGARSPAIGVPGRHSPAPALGSLWTGRSSDSDDLPSSCRQATMLRMAPRPGQVTKRGRPFARAKRGPTDATHRYGWAPNRHRSRWSLIHRCHRPHGGHQTVTKPTPRQGSKMGPKMGPPGTPSGTPSRGPPGPGPRPGPRGPPGAPRPGPPRAPPGAPRAPPGAPRGTPLGTPKMAPFGAL